MSLLNLITIYLSKSKCIINTKSFQITKNVFPSVVLIAVLFFSKTTIKIKIKKKLISNNLVPRTLSPCVKLQRQESLGSKMNFYNNPVKSLLLFFDPFRPHYSSDWKLPGHLFYILFDLQCTCWAFATLAEYFKCIGFKDRTKRKQNGKFSAVPTLDKP